MEIGKVRIVDLFELFRICDSVVQFFDATQLEINVEVLVVAWDVAVSLWVETPALGGGGELWRVNISCA